MKSGIYKIRAVICLNCKVVFNTKRPTKQFCSKDCKSIYNIKPCPVCSGPLKKDSTAKFCSPICVKIGMKTRKGCKLTEEHKLKLSVSHLITKKGKLSEKPNWKGGKDTEKQRQSGYRLNRRTALKIKLDLNFIDILFKVQKGLCFYCEKDLKNYKSLDHLNSIKNGGDNHNYNLVWSCKTCNSTKKDKNFINFCIFTERLFLIEKHFIIYSLSKKLNER